MGSLSKAQELRIFLGLAIKLRALADTSEDLGDTELFLAAALTLEQRANHMAFGGLAPVSHPRKVDLLC
jgi:hypothetical protein